MRGKKAKDTASKQPYTVDEVIRAIERAHGKITYASQLLGCTPQNIYIYINKYASVRQARDNARDNFKEGMLDVAEVKLMKAVNGGEKWAVRYSLDTLGKERGYIQSTPQINLAVSIINNYPILPELIEAMEKANMSPASVFEKMLQRIQQETLSDGA